VEGLAQVIEFKQQEQEKKKARRERGAGRIFKPRHHGKESAFWWIQYYSRGRQIRESSKSEKLAVAERLLRQRLGEAAAGILRSPRVERIKYEELRDALIADYQTNGRKWLRKGKDGKPYICGISTLDGFFEGFRAVDITTDRLREFIRKQQDGGAANGTINRTLALLRRMFNLAVQDSKLRDIPYFPMLKEAPPRKGFLEHADFLRLRSELPEYLRSVLTMGYFTGMRLGEILGLRWSNVSVSDAQVRLDAGSTKNDDARNIPLTGELLEMLKIERQRNPSAEFVFVRDGERIGSFRKAWASACVRLGLAAYVWKCKPCKRVCENPSQKCESCGNPLRRSYRGLIPHDLRRCGVRNLVRAGVPERVAMAISGHRQRQVFERYNIVSERDLKLAASKLESYLGHTRTP
jgi:integrase